MIELNPTSDLDDIFAQAEAAILRPDRAPFVDRCHFSETGFAIWKWNEYGTQYCTCVPPPRPEAAL